VREREGAITLAVLVVVMLAAALVQKLLAGRSAGRRLRLPRHAPAIATLLICAGLAAAIVAGAKETSGQPSLSGGATRLVSLQSNRYDYWDVALRAFATSPLHGVGAGGWSVYWLRWRSVNEFAQNAHSLELETLAELGLVGLALLLAFFGGVGLAARQALVAGRAVAGPVAALVVYVAHSPLDWDWQMPAVTLVAIVLAGYLLAFPAGTVTAPRRSAAPPA
jgi:O-antigen ligase